MEVGQSNVRGEIERGLQFRKTKRVDGVEMESVTEAQMKSGHCAKSHTIGKG